MNKLIAIVAALAFAGTAFAQTPAPAAEKSGVAKGAVKAEQKKADKPAKKSARKAEKKAEAKK